MKDSTFEDILSLPSSELQAAVKKLFKDKTGFAKLSGWTDTSKHRNHFVHRLAILGDVPALELLASKSVDINLQRSPDLCTPLHLAIWHGQPAVTKALRALGANQDLANSFGETARDAERQRDKRYVCWHQQADLLVNVSPIVLRRLFRERWAAYVGSEVDVGRAILRGSDDRIALSDHTSVRSGSSRLYTDEDLTGAVAKGQPLWIDGFEVEAAGPPRFTPPAGRLLGGSEVPLESPWPGQDVRAGRLAVQRTPPEPRLPPGTDAYKKIRSGKVDSWDLTLLCHFLGEEQCRLACLLVPKPEERQLVRQLKDARNRVCLHQGRTEVEPDVLDSTARMLQEACDALLPASSGEVQRLVDEARSRTVVPEGMLEEMEHGLAEEREKVSLMEACVSSVSRFREYLPPGAFSTSSATASTASATDTASEWSATRGRSVWVSTGPLRICESVPEVLAQLQLPPHCDAQVVSKCIELAAECPSDKSLLLVVRTAASRLGDVMLDKLGCSSVHRHWKDQRLIVADVSPSTALYEDWCLPDGVLISGEHGRVLRVTAQFRPPEGTSQAKSPVLRRASDIACAVESVVIASECGEVYISTTDQATSSEYFQLRSAPDLDSDCDAMSVWRGAETATEAVAEGGGSSTAQKVWEFFWPHMTQREHLTQTLLPQAAEQVQRWSTGEAEINTSSAELVSENTAKWLWTFICADQPADLINGALRTCSLVLARLQESEFHAHEPRLLIPMGEANRVLGNAEEAISLFHRARKLGSEHSDFENGFSAHSMLFNIYVRLNKTGEARAMLVGARLLLEKESSSHRVGPGMDEFLRAKQTFLKSNQARLDAKLALQTGDAASLRVVKGLIEEAVAEMTDMQGSQFRGNTDRNMAELLCLLCKVAWACEDTATVRHALERELPLRRTRAQEGEAIVTLTNLGRVCVEVADLDAAERYLREAEIMMQSLTGVAASDCQAVRQEVLWMLASCAEKQGDLHGALSQLRLLAEILPRNLDDGSVRREIARIEALRPPDPPVTSGDRHCSPNEQPPQDLRGLDELAAFIEGSSKSPPKSKKEKRAQAKDANSSIATTTTAGSGTGVFTKDKSESKAAVEKAPVLGKDSERGGGAGAVNEGTKKKKGKAKKKG